MKLYIEDGQNFPAVKVQQDADPAPPGYTEVTGIEDFVRYGLNTTNDDTVGWIDRLCFRDQLKTMIYAKMGVVTPADVDDPAKWNLLNANEKSIACHYFVVAAEAFFTEVNSDPRYWILQSGEYRRWTQDARTQRTNLCEAVIFMRMLNLGDAKLILADMNQVCKDTVLDIDGATNQLNQSAPVKRMNQMYIEGLEDQANDGVAAIKDWIQSTVGTPFEGNGFMDLAYPFKVGHTSASVRDELLSIIDGTF
jgi:hypothetical protein